MGGSIFGTKFVLGAACGATLVAWAVCAQAQQQPPGLTPQAMQQIQAIGVEKSQRTDAQKKIDSGLLYAARAARGQPQFPNAPGLSLPQLSASNLVGADGRVLVDIATTDATGLAGPIQSLGGSVISSFPASNAVRASMPVTALESLAAVASVLNIRPAEEPTTNRILPPQGSSSEPRSGIMREQLGGVVGVNGSDVQTNVGFGTTISEAVVAHGANTVQNAGVTGAGIKICVISNGVSTLAQRQAAGELPAVQILGTGQASSSGDEGTAMLELVADMAPGATLGFSTGNGGAAQMAQNITNLRNVMGCNIIVDDLTYFAEGAFQEDVIANAVTTVVNAGAMYFSSAANSGHLTGGQSGTWEGDFVNGGPAPAVLGEPGTVHNFGAALFDTLTASTALVSLKWSDPIGASANDYDLFVVNSAGSAVLGSSTNVQNGTQNPFESTNCGGTCPSGARIYVVLFSGSARALRVDTHRGRVSIGTNGSTFGHNGGVNTISVAAVSNNFQPISGREFLPTDTTASYSSDGPRRLFLNPVPATTAITPGCVLYGCGGGTVLSKVDIAAADCDTTTTPGFAPFCGTSAAAPQAAAIAALVKAANPAFTNAQVLARMKSTAIDIMAAGTDVDSGAGIVMADKAVTGTVSVVIHDFDGNGKSDILWRNANGDTTIWFMNGFQVVSGGGMGNVPTIWAVVGTGDFNGDGKTDIFWRNSGGDLAIWLMNGNAVVSGGGLGNVPLSWTIAGVADFNGDGKADILFRNNNGDASIWFMNGLQVTSGSGLGNIPTVWTSVGTGDFNGDGKADILWRNNNGDLSIWFMNGSQVVSGAGLGNVTTDWGVAGVRDFNGDGKSDIVWRNINGDVAMWFLNGSQVLSGGGLGNVPTSWTIVQTADFNGDTKGDLLWRNANGDASVWLMNGSTISGTGGLGNIPTSWAVQSINAN